MTRLAPWSALALLMFLAVLAPEAQAQVRLRCSLDNNTYLLYEQINLSVTIENMSGNVLDFGDGDNPKGSLYVEITDGSNRPRANWRLSGGRASQFNALKGISISPGTRETVSVPLDLFHDLDQAGTYDVRCVVRHKRMKYEFVSDVMNFKIREGTLMWENNLGVPNRDPNAEIQMRKAQFYTLKDRSGLTGFFQISDDYNIYNTVRVGHIVEGSPLDIQVDTLSQVHMLVPSQPRLISYLVYDIHGRRQDYRKYYIKDRIPFLQRDPDIGRVMVVGGTPMVEPKKFDEEDLPVMTVH